MGRISSQMKQHFTASFFGCYGSSCLGALAVLFLKLLSSDGRSWLDWLQYYSSLTQLENRWKFSPSHLLFIFLTLAPLQLGASFIQTETCADRLSV